MFPAPAGGAGGGKPVGTSSDSLTSPDTSPGTSDTSLIGAGRPSSTAAAGAGGAAPVPPQKPPSRRNVSAFEVEKEKDKAKERGRSRSRSASRSPPPPTSSSSTNSSTSSSSSASHHHHHQHGKSSSSRSTSSRSTTSSNNSSSRPIRGATGSSSHRSSSSHSSSHHHRNRSRSNSTHTHTRTRSRSRAPSSSSNVHPLLAWWRIAKTSRQFKWGLGLFITGLILVTIAGITNIEGSAYRHAKIREAVVVDAPSHPEFKAWVGGSQIKTPLYYSYHLYNITNPQQFLAGKAPTVDEVGPYTFEQKTRKYDVTFSDSGRLVSYITLTQHEYVGEEEELDMHVYSFNLPYSVAVYTAGSETNLLKIGSQQGLSEILAQMQMYFLPTLKENAVVMAIEMAAAAMKTALDALQWPDDATQTRWGGGCTSNIFGKVCGFNAIASFFQAVDRKNKMDLNLLQLCINTKIPEAEKIPLATVKRLWDARDEYSILNIDRYNASTRYGISYWLWGDYDVQETITTHFGLTRHQFNLLRIYLLEIYRSPMLEAAVIKIFQESIPEADAGTAEIYRWSDFMWRQWAVGDVITRLKNESMALPESMQPELPPEYAWYAESQGVQTFNYGGKRWNRTQAMCMFDLAKRPMVYFQTKVLGLPGPKIERPTFVDFGLEEAGDVLMDPRDCFQSTKDWQMMQGYLAHLATAFVAPELQKDVLSNNGGLVTKRSLKETLYGYAAPILQLSLAKDDPRAMRFSLLANDPSLNGPARCLSSNDVENPYTACKFSSLNTTQNDDGSTRTMRLFSKVPNTYHTGKDEDARAGAFYTYHGDRNIANIWPGGSIPFAGAVKGEPGSVQYGYSDGMQFPPFDAISGPDTVLNVFVPGFVLPLRFAFEKDVEVEGIKLKRFRLAADTFSSTRADAKTFSMDQVTQEGLFNMTDLMVGEMYFTKPHYRPTAPYDMADIKGLKDYDAERDDSYIDVEPTTGKTMNANIQLQMTAGTTAGVFDQFHKNVYPIKALPVLHVAQHASVVAEDAKFFKTMVYMTEKLIKLVTVVGAALGAFFLLVGLALILYHTFHHAAADMDDPTGAAGAGRARKGSLKGGDEEMAIAAVAAPVEGDVEMLTRKPSSKY